MALALKIADKSLISVVIPTYNENKYLAQCLDALKHQSVRPNAVYVIDNNSTDNSASIAKSYTFVTFLSEPEQGICAATQKGLNEAAQNGGIILRLDADCRPSPDWIERMVNILEKDNNYIAATGPGVAYDAYPAVQFLMTWLYMKPYFMFVGFALGQKPLFGSNFAIRASVSQKISTSTHLHHQDIHNDIDISYHIAQLGSTYYDRNVHMPISSRPIRAPIGKMVGRYVAGFRSIFIHWPEQAPWRKFI